MTKNRVEDFTAFQKACELFDYVFEDMNTLRDNPMCYRLISQQIASADSICANMEEGYGRLSTKEYVRFLDIFRGSAGEIRGRYLRMKHWLPETTIESRVSLADEIIAIITASINTLRKKERGLGNED